MIKAESICQEFCDQVSVSSKLALDPVRLFKTKEELKCRLDIKYFTPLMERMVQSGYCCTQVQKDLDRGKCTAWFERADLEEIV